MMVEPSIVHFRVPEALHNPNQLLTGTPYELQPSHQQAEEPIKSNWRSLFVFVGRSDYLIFVLAVGTTFLSACTKPAIGVCFGQIFSSFTKFAAGSINSTQCFHAIRKWCVALFCIACGSWLVEAVYYFLWGFFGELQARAVRLRLFEGILGKSIEWFDLRSDGIGALTNRINTQVRELQLALSQPLGTLLYHLFTVVTSFGLSFYYSWKLTLVVAGIVLVFFFPLRLASCKLITAIEAEKHELTQASKYINTAITNISTVKAYNGQDQELAQYCATIKNAGVHSVEQALSNATSSCVMKWLEIAVFVVGFWFGLFLVGQGLSPGHVLTTFYACTNAMAALQPIVPLWMNESKGMSAGATLKRLISQLRDVRTGQTLTTKTGTLRPASCPGEIAFTKVSFAYPSNKEQSVLRDITFIFPARALVFIVGSSGSGKSTLGHLLMKYYDPTSGSISLDGKPLDDLDPDWVRHNITLAQQESVLFNESISKNIEFGRHGSCSVDEIADACKAADLEQTLGDLPKGLQTFVGLGGQALSGGQQQRVVIARSRLRDSPILILDEATSALDKKSRAIVMNEIRKVRQGKTTLVITHDLSQIRDHEFVYVVQNGRSVQAGICGDLAKIKGGAFAALLDATDALEVTRRASINNGLETITRNSVYDHNMFDSGGRQPSIDYSRLRRRPDSFLMIAGGKASWSEYSKAPPNIANDGPFELSQMSSSRKSSTFANSSQPSAPKTSNQLSQNFENIGKDFGALDVPRRRSSVKGLGFSLPARAEFQVRNFDAATESQQRIIELPAKEEAVPQVIVLPEEDFLKRPASLKIIFQTVWPNLHPRQRIFLVLGFVLSTATAALTSAWAYVFTQLLAVYYLPTGRNAAGRKWALILLAIGIVEGLCVAATEYIMEYCGQRWVNALRQEAMKRILLQPREWFDKGRNSVSSLTTTLDRHAEESRNLIGRFAGPCYIVFWTAGISFTWSMIISWQLTLVALAFAPFFVAAAQIFFSISGEWETRSNEAAERTHTIFTETFTKIRVVRALALEKYFKGKYADFVSSALKIGRSRAIRAALIYGVHDALICLLIGFVFLLAGAIVTKRQLEVTTCLQVVNLLMFGAAASVQTINMIGQVSSAQSAASYVIHLAKLSISEAPETTGYRRLRTPFPIVFDNLSFTYPCQFERVLKGISFSLHPGSCTGIVGPSGSGKSTVTSLLLGLYMPDEVTLDCSTPLSFAGVPINQCNLHSLRNQIAIVAQKPLLFPATILANIIYGLPEGSPYANLASAMQAAKEADIHNFITGLTEGYSTLVGDGGQGLSGGQAQRIAIARALVRRPRLLILDEATSALDAVGAKEIRTTVKHIIKRGRETREHAVAVVIISHAMEMMRICEHLVVLKDGKVAERGGFGELAGAGGVFAEMLGYQPKQRLWGLRAEDDVFGR